MTVELLRARCMCVLERNVRLAKQDGKPVVEEAK